MNREWMVAYVNSAAVSIYPATQVRHALIATIIRFTCPCAKERRSLEMNTP